MPTPQVAIPGNPAQERARRWISRAPGRVNIIGEHVDYNDGWVLPMAIEREILIRATAREDRRVCFSSRQAGEALEIDLDQPDIALAPAWGKYLLGVLLEFQRATGVALPGFDGVIDSTVPLGGGLSSSAALCVATATLLEKVSEAALNRERHALEADDLAILLADILEPDDRSGVHFSYPMGAQVTRGNGRSAPSPFGG